MSEARGGTVYLTGAGPGAPDLLTLRAHALITSATCILHDDLVSDAVVALVAANALVVNVGKRCGQKLVTQEQIHEWMIGYARDGQSVVRLKSGDPMLFGRAAEEMFALEQAGIPFEIVPGVSSGFAAAAAALVSLTDRDATSRVVFTTRHRAGNVTGGFTSLDVGSTLVLYMPGKDYAKLQGELLEKGWPADTRCVLISAASSAAQRVHKTPLSELNKTPSIPAPTVILVLAQPAE